MVTIVYRLLDCMKRHDPGWKKIAIDGILADPSLISFSNVCKIPVDVKVPGKRSSDRR